MSGSFGPRLRRERERRKISLASLAAATKIKTSLFDSLEREDSSHWPPPGIFRRSFVRAYAAGIGLDPDEVVREFLELFPEPEEAPALPARGSPKLKMWGAIQAAVPAPSASPAGLRLTLADSRRPFTGGRRLLADTKRRWTAIAWDGGLLVAVSLVCFAVLGVFWKPLGVTALCYYLTSILILGNTPGVCLFAPRPKDDEDLDPPRDSDAVDDSAPQLHPEFHASI